MFREVGTAVNDGERLVLQRLRDELPDDWFVIANFEFPSGARWYECDALALSPEGWAYLIETKHWIGAIRGNDHEWILPSLTGGHPRSVTSPVHITTSKSKKIATYFKAHVPGSDKLFVQPLVVLVTEDQPVLSGRSATQTVTLADVVRAVRVDPRAEQARRPLDDGVAQAIFDFMIDSVRPLSPTDALGPYTLLELVQETETTETWEATLASAPEVPYRVKRYFIDPLLTGADRERQTALVRRDLEALVLLRREEGVVPLVGNVLEADNSFVVATEWPSGRCLAAQIAEGLIPEDEAEPLLREMFRSLAAVHKHGITHRNLRPSCLYVADGRVFITDFDFARIEDRPGVTGAITPGALDAKFIAPEVLLDPASAGPRSDLYSAGLIAREVLGCAGVQNPPELLENLLKSCLSRDPEDRPRDALELVARLSNRPSTPVAVDSLDVNDVIDKRFVVRQRANTTGGTAVVYRVFDQNVQEEYAAKFVRPELSEHVDVFDEYRRLSRLPNHPGVVRPAFPMAAHRVRRGESDRELQANFLLTEWVEGTSLAELVSQDLPAVRVMQIGAEVARALESIHSVNVVHRDIKPENVILRADGHPVIIDFNISAGAADSLKTAVGTRGYVPLGVLSQQEPWSAAADVYALGVCLTELLAGKRLGAAALPTVRDWTLGEELAAFRDALLGMLNERAESRPDAGTVAELLDAALERFTHARRSPTLDNPPDYESEGEGHNPYLEKLIGLFSQSSVSNAGTRGLDEFRKWLYVETRIDRELRPAVLSGGIKLLVITGNAGDGKTAFIRMIEEELKARGASSEPRVAGNGALLLHAGLRFVTNWDGSQDEGASANDDVLREFLEPFIGVDPTPAPDLVSIIAINEGRLLDFLMDNRKLFPWLEEELLRVLGGEQPAVEWLSVVNLNLRSLTAPATGGESIVEGLLQKMSDERLWGACNSCAIADSCYARANAQVLRDPVLGPRSAERIRQALDLVRLRRRLHITMRDLVSALAYVVAGNRSCSEIGKLVEDQSLKELVSGFSYNALFAARDAGLVDTRGAERDRLLAQLAPLDVAIRPLPELDGRLWLRGVDALPVATIQTEQHDRGLLNELWDLAREAGRESDDWDGLRVAHASLRRKFYVEREDPHYFEMFPYEHLTSFMEALMQPPSMAVSDIAEAISHSEGLRSSNGRGLLAVRVIQDPGAENRSFVAHSADQFSLEVLRREAEARFLESLPDLLRLSHRVHPALALDIDVDLWEALMRMRSGFIPSREDLRGSWLSLQTFKERVASMPSRELLIQPRVGESTTVRVSDEGRIVAGVMA